MKKQKKSRLTKHLKGFARISAMRFVTVGLILVATHLVALTAGYALRDSGWALNGGVEPTPSAVATMTPTACSQPLDKDGLLIKTNELRLKNGRKQLITARELETYAQLRAEELASTKNVVHESKYGKFSEWATANQIKPTSPYDGIQEDLTGPITSPCEAVDGFEKSPTHRDSIVDPGNEYVGVGYKDGYVVLILGNPKE